MNYFKNFPEATQIIIWSPAHLSAIREPQKRGPGTLQILFQNLPNRGHIFKNKLRDMQAVIRKTVVSRLEVYMFSVGQG